MATANQAQRTEPTCAASAFADSHEIPAVCDELNGSLRSLDDTLSRLEDRLAAVLCDTDPSLGDASGVSKLRESPNNSPLSRELDVRIREVYELNARVHNMLDRLTL